jgi:hypothetical protein
LVAQSEWLAHEVGHWPLLHRYPGRQDPQQVAAAMQVVLHDLNAGALQV